METSLSPPSKRSWLKPLIAGVCLSLVAFIGYRLAFPPLDPIIVDGARNQHLDARTYGEVMGLMGTAEQQHALSDHDWERLKALFINPDPRIGGYAVGTMGYLARTPHRTEVLSLVRPLLVLDERQAGNGERKADAMILLWQYNEPDWRTYAEQGLRNTDPLVHHAAKTLLEQGEHRLKRPGTQNPGTTAQ